MPANPYEPPKGMDQGRSEQRQFPWRLVIEGLIALVFIAIIAALLLQPIQVGGPDK